MRGPRVPAPVTYRRVDARAPQRDGSTSLPEVRRAARSSWAGGLGQRVASPTTTRSSPRAARSNRSAAASSSSGAARQWRNQKPTTVASRASARPCSASFVLPRRDAVGDEAAERRQRLERRVEDLRPPIASSTTSTRSAAVGLEEALGEARPRSRPRRPPRARARAHASRPSTRWRSRARRRAARRAARPATPVRPRRRGRRRSRPRDAGAGPQQVPGGQALEQQRQRGAVVDAVRDREGVRGAARRPARRSRRARRSAPRRARPCRRDARRPPSPGSAAARRGEVLVAALVRVGEVHPRARDLDQDLAVARARGPRRVTSAAAERLLRPRLIGAPDGPAGAVRTATSLVRRMSLTVVGSIAYDAVKTPAGERERMLGGAATHFALAASFFDDVRVIGPVGDDFGDGGDAVLGTRGTITDDVERVAGGKTFFWRGQYEPTSTRARRSRRELNVFETTSSPSCRRPAAAPTSCSSPTSSPTCSARCASSARRALRRDGLDGPLDQHRARLARGDDRGVDCVLLNDEELGCYRASRTSSARARDPDLGPAARRRQAGQVRRGAVHRGRLLRAARVSRSSTSSTRPAPATRSRAASSASSPPTRDEPLNERAGAPRDGLRHGAGLVQRRGLRHRADDDLTSDEIDGRRARAS